MVRGNIMEWMKLAWIDGEVEITVSSCEWNEGDAD